MYEPGAGVTETFSKYSEVAATPQIPVDQQAEHAKALVYTTEPLQEPLELAGPMELPSGARRRHPMSTGS